METVKEAESLSGLVSFAKCAKFIKRFAKRPEEVQVRWVEHAEAFLEKPQKFRGRVFSPAKPWVDRMLPAERKQTLWILAASLWQAKCSQLAEQRQTEDDLEAWDLI